MFFPPLAFEIIPRAFEKIGFERHPLSLFKRERVQISKKEKTKYYCKLATFSQCCLVGNIDLGDHWPISSNVALRQFNCNSSCVLY